MENRIVKLVYNYLKENKDIDDYFIKSVVDIAVDYYCLDKYIKGVLDININKIALAVYLFNDKIICTNVNLISEETQSLKNEFECINKSMLFKYIYCIHTVMHEVEHAYQYKKIDEFDNIESIILREEQYPVYEAMKKGFISKIIYNRKLNKLRGKYYIFAPSERLAEIYSYEFARNISLFFEDEMCYDVMEYFRLQNLLRGYNIGLTKNLSDTPTMYYLNQINPDNKHFIIDDLSRNVCSKDLMKLGLKTPKSVLRKTLIKKNTLIRKIEKNRY